MTITLVLPFDVGTADSAGASLHGDAIAVRGTDVMVAFLDNHKARAAELLDAIGAALVASGSIREYFVHRKRHGLLPLEDDERDEVFARANVIVSGVGDCGGCTAATVTDALRARAENVPAFCVVTTNFEPVARSVIDLFDGPKPTVLLVDHPVFPRDRDWFEATGATLAANIMASVAVPALATET
jgi:hypothetical protein